MYFFGKGNNYQSEEIVIEWGIEIVYSCLLDQVLLFRIKINKEGNYCMYVKLYYLVNKGINEFYF